MLIEILILLFIIIIFYEIFNDSFSKQFGMYENFANATDLTKKNNKDIEELEIKFNNRKKEIDNVNTNLSKINQNIDTLNQEMKIKNRLLIIENLDFQIILFFYLMMKIF